MSGSEGSQRSIQYDYLFKLLVIGESSVGKSSLLLRFTEDVFNQSYSTTIGVDFKVRTMVVDNCTIKLQIWDTAGQEQFRTLASSYYRGAHGILIVYDITNKKTFDSVPYWLKNIERFAGDDVIKLLVGNKSDLDSGRKVSYWDAKLKNLLYFKKMLKEQMEPSRCQDLKFADENYMQFIETSAKSSENVEEAFVKIAREIKELVAPIPYVASNNDSIRLGDTLPVNESSSSSWWYC